MLGNALVCLVVLRDKNMRTTMNFLLVNLAISDMIVGVFSTFRLVIPILPLNFHRYYAWCLSASKCSSYRHLE